MEMIGARIAHLRKSRGMTQHELADMAKKHVDSIRYVEDGRTRPTLKTLEKICNVLRCDLADLIDGTDYVDGFAVTVERGVNVITMSDGQATKQIIYRCKEAYNGRYCKRFSCSVDGTKRCCADCGDVYCADRCLNSPARCGLAAR